MSALKWRPSPAMLVAALAVSIAFVGTAAAGPIDNPIAQDSRLGKKDRRIAAKISRKITVRLIKRFTRPLANKQINQRAPGLSVGNAAGVNDGAISTDKLADDAVTGEKINESSTPFGRVVHSAEGDSTQAVGGGFTIYPLNDNTYTQDAGENNNFFAGLDVTFEAGCIQPRDVQVLLLVDPVNPAVPTINDVAAQGAYSDTSAGEVSRRVHLGPFPGGGVSTLFRPGSDEQHTLYLLAQRSCTAGDGVNATFGGVDVIGTK